MARRMRLPRYPTTITTCFIPLQESDLSICSKMLINAGIEKIFYENGYEDPLADQMITEAGIEIVRFAL